MDRVLTLEQNDLPPLFQAADQISQAAQSRFLRGLRAEVLLLVIVAIIGMFSWKVNNIDWIGIFAVFVLFLVMILQLHWLLNHPERLWYEGRAVAESTKSLA